MGMYQYQCACAEAIGLYAFIEAHNAAVVAAGLQGEFRIFHRMEDLNEVMVESDISYIDFARQVDMDFDTYAEYFRIVESFGGAPDRIESYNDYYLSDAVYADFEVASENDDYRTALLARTQAAVEAILSDDAPFEVDDVIDYINGK